MTADINSESSATNKNSTTINLPNSNIQQPDTESATGRQPIQLPTAILEIIEFLTCNNKIVFKSQQIDDPELLRSEKVEIACEIYEKSRPTFLNRFGNYLEEQHLTTFSKFILNDEHGEEMHLQLQDHLNKLHTRKRDVKNRRYAAMQKLISEGEYFSEQEMMRRAPELYQDLIGQYLSEAEKKQRDEYDVKNTSFSGILMHTIEQREIQDVLRRADTAVREKQICKDASAEDSASQNSSNDSNEQEHVENVYTDDDEVPPSFRQQWGNFDNESVACSTSQQIKPTTTAKVQTKYKIRKNLKSETFITAGERDLLRQEFIGIMYEHFLNGDDEDFDYTQVDDNSELDDLTQLNQDKEDAYFEETDGSEDSRMIQNNHRDDEQSEDELDVFMNHLSKHHSLQ